MVWVSCEGESPADIENLGPVNYSPRRGFPAYYFPYKNVRGYQPPIVAVQFERPKCEYMRARLFLHSSLITFLLVRTHFIWTESLLSLRMNRTIVTHFHSKMC